MVENGISKCVTRAKSVTDGWSELKGTLNDVSFQAVQIEISCHDICSGKISPSVCQILDILLLESAVRKGVPSGCWPPALTCHWIVVRIHILGDYKFINR